MYSLLPTPGRRMPRQRAKYTESVYLVPRVDRLIPETFCRRPLSLSLCSRHPFATAPPQLNNSLVLRARVSQVWVGGHCRWDKVNNDSRIGPLDSTGKHETEATSSQGPSSPSLLSGSGMPGKNGPKRKRTRSSSDRNGSSSNPWLSGGIGRMGRCRCCS